MNKLSPKEGRHLTADLVECALMDNIVDNVDKTADNVIKMVKKWPLQLIYVFGQWV